MADDRDFLDAAQIGDYHLVDTLLRKGQSADTHDDHGQTALALSAMYGHARVASRLFTTERHRTTSYRWSQTSDGSRHG